MITREELIKLAIAAAFAALARESLTAIIGRGKTAFTTLRKKTPHWVARYGRAMEFGAALGLFLFWIGVFVMLPADSQPVTYGGVRALLLYFVCMALMFGSTVGSFIRWRRYNANRKHGKQEPSENGDVTMRQMKFGELEFTLNAGQPYQSGTLIFDVPFNETPVVFISECRGGNWLVLKIDSKDENGFRWAAHRVFPTQQSLAGPYTARAQWLAVSPGLISKVVPPGKLSIDHAAYGVNGVALILTNILRARVKNDSLQGICGNELGGDPYYGQGKQLTIEYTFQGKKLTATIAENHPFNIP